MRRIFIGADHRGFKAKEALLPILKKLPDIETVIDCGPIKYDEADDFNDPAILVCRNIVKDLDNNFGILICGSSFGVCIQANRFKQIRAVNPLDEERAKLGREHNNANVLCLSADQLKDDKIEAIVKEFFSTKYSGKERYERRNQRLDKEI